MKTSLSRCSLIFILLISLSHQVWSKKCGGTERWPIKVMADKASNQINPQPKTLTVADLIQLPTDPVGTSTPRHGVEMATYRVVCGIKEYTVESDSDIHLVLFDLNDPTKTMVAEIPNPSCKSVDKSGRKSYYKNDRTNFLTYTTDGMFHENGKKYSVKTGQYELIGVGFIDFPHGQLGKAPNNLEIHPVLKITKLN